MENQQNSLPPGYSANDVTSFGTSQPQQPLANNGGLPPGYSPNDITSFGAQPTAPKSDEVQAPNDGDDLATKAAKYGAGTLEGIGEGVFGTIAGGADLLGARGTGISKSLHHLAGDDNATHGTAQNIGQGIEAIGEFMMGDEALKGLSFADKLKHVSGVMKFLEKSPKLAKALELGINVGKAGTELSPEERALIQQHPILARLVGHGLSALRQGVTQGIQTEVKTGGNTAEALKSGATMAGTSALIGAPLAVGGGLLAKGAQAANTAEELAGKAAGGPTETTLNSQLENTVHGSLQPNIDAAQAVKDEAEGQVANAAQSPASMAANAPEHEAITAAAQKAAKNAHAALGDEFEKGRETLKKATEGHELTFQDSPYQQVAKDALGTAKEDAHELDEAANKTRPGSGFANDKLQKLADPYGEADLKEAAKETGPDGEKKTPTAQQAQDELDAIAEKKANKPITMTMDQLLDHRKSLNENLRKTGWATDEQRADRDIYHKLIGGVDDSIQQLTEQSGNPEAMETLKKMNADYKTGITRFQNADVKGLLQGTTNDVAKKLMSGATSVADINTVRDAIGKDAFQRLADSSVQRMAADAIDKTTGQFNFKTFFNNWTRIPPQVRQTMFQESMNGGAVENAIKQAQMVNASGAIPGAEATIKDTTDTIQDLMGNGSVKTLLGDPERVQQLAATVGPEAMGELGTSVLQNQLREAATNAKGALGNVNTDKVLKFISSLKDSPEIVEALFRPTTERAAAYDKLLKDINNVNGMKNLIKYGVITPTLGAAGGAAVGHSLIPALIGAFAAEGANGFTAAKELLDRIANHPATWATLKAAGKAAASPVATGATVVSKVAAGRAANALRQSLLGASGSLQ